MPMGPSFSIIVPTYDRARPLAACLDAIARLTYPRTRFEVVVVDDGGRTSPAETVEAFRDRLPVRLLSQAHGGPAKARNLGAERAHGDVLVFIDDDCLVGPDLLERLAVHFASTAEVGIGGRTINALTDNVYSTATQAVLDYVCVALDGRGPSARFFCANNLALPAELFRRVGGFDDTMMTGEDRDLCDRWSSHGLALRYCPDVTIRHVHPLTLATFWRQHFNYGRGSCRFRRSSARRHRRAFALERPTFYLDLLRHGTVGIGGARAVTVRLLLALSQAATAAGFATQLVAEWTRRAR